MLAGVEADPTHLALGSGCVERYHDRQQLGARVYLGGERQTSFARAGVAGVMEILIKKDGAAPAQCLIGLANRQEHRHVISVAANAHRTVERGAVRIAFAGKQVQKIGDQLSREVIDLCGQPGEIERLKTQDRRLGKTEIMPRQADGATKPQVFLPAQIGDGGNSGARVGWQVNAGRNIKAQRKYVDQRAARLAGQLADREANVVMVR